MNTIGQWQRAARTSVSSVIDQAVEHARRKCEPFWPDSDVFPEPAFYSYAYPQPQGFRDCKPPDGANFDVGLGEFTLRYETVRSASDPDALLLNLPVKNCEAAADCGNWDRAGLECQMGIPGQVRVV